MVEPIIYAAIGFLLATLLGMAIMPLVHNRAVRLTTRRLEATAPVSRAEVEADKDQLRASFAVSARRLETTIDQLGNKAASQAAELGRKADAVNRMKMELSARNAEIFALQAREQDIDERLRATAAELATTAAALQEARQTLAAREADAARLTAELADQSQATATRQAELATVQEEIGRLKQCADEVERESTATREQLDAERAAAEALRQQIAAQAAQIAARDEENARLRTAREEAETAVKQLRDEVFALTNGGSGAPTPAAPGGDADTALLRERIGDIAAEVARLTMTLEGPDSPIKAILEAEPRRTANGGAAAASPPTLVDRIRALQAQAATGTGPRAEPPET